ncbi:serine/threonine-protein kinase [Cellulomonas chengniuliangii]|uniref:serine/threonine-protein kinase n=1 Tax=Cellulomonas chengniuliangii TaxID=2968084 RepID=UPI001D0EEBF4|nr:serine/threonine-protein kinase [Cellulomonas chengniuliangii]MCC2317784.1 serine/threonine protein kinase [Cellulomonas chengniuliangii]
MERIGLEPGSEVGGYTVVAPLGSGGMGTVYRALDGAGNAVALKLLHPHVGADPAARDRLRREVVALQRLRHPAVAAVLDAEADSTEAFIVTELVAGRNLEDHVRDNGPLDLDQLAEFADGLHGALAAVHEAGVVHRDLKPSNVLVTDSGPVLIDFGIAQAADDPRITSTGLVIGTPGYLAPELLDDAEPTAETDWWGWAAVLAFAATGRPPFGLRPLAAVIARARSGEADLVGLGPRTADALRHALAGEAADRLPPADLVDELHEAAASGDAHFGPDGDETAVLHAADAHDTEVFGGPATQRLDADPATQRLPMEVDPTAVWGPAAGATQLYPVQRDVRRDSAYPRADGPGDTAVFGAAQDEHGHDGPDDWAGGYDDGDDRAGYGGGWDGQGGVGPWAADPASPEEAGSGYARPPARRRWGTTLALGLLAVAGSATFPGVTLVVLAVVLVLVRTVGSASEAMHRRRERKGVRGSDALVATMSSPWHLLRAIVGLLPSVIVASSVVVIVLGAVWWLIGSGSWTPGGAAPGRTPSAEFTAVLIAGAFLLGLVVLWWGPMSALTRIGTRRVLGAVAPGRTGATVVVLISLAITAMLTAQALSGEPLQWAPLPEVSLPEVALADVRVTVPGLLDHLR